MPQEPSLFEGALPNDPAAITLAFIEDYERWNSFAYASYEATSSFSAAEMSYESLLLKYCGPAKAHLNVAFGSEANHKAECATIKNCTIETESAVVWTEETNVHGFTNEYQYLFRKLNDRWLLDEVFYLDDYDDNKPLPNI